MASGNAKAFAMSCGIVAGVGFIVILLLAVVGAMVGNSDEGGNRLRAEAPPAPPQHASTEIEPVITVPSRVQHTGATPPIVPKKEDPVHEDDTPVLLEGMTVAEVQEAMGVTGERVNHMRMGDKEQSTYVWYSEVGVLTATFTDEEMVQWVFQKHRREPLFEIVSKVPSESPASSVSSGNAPRPWEDVVEEIRLQAEIDWPDNSQMRAYEERRQKEAYRDLQRGNHYKIPESVFDDIRDKAQAAWPDDYSMQQYEEKSQIESYRNLQRGNRYGIPEGVFLSIRQNAQRESPKDYRMQEYEEKSQAEAYRSIQRGNWYDIPDNTYQNLRRRAEEEWPNDYRMQEYLIKRGAQAYHDA